MKMRIFMGTKKDLNIGVLCDLETKKATGVKYNYESSQAGLASSREVALYGLIEIMKKVDVKTLDMPAQIFLVSSLSDFITKQTYKYWVVTGKKADGSEIEPSELKLWKEFEKIMAKKGSYFIFKSIMDANFRGNAKFNQAEVKYNKFYYDWVMSKIHEIYPQGPEAPDLQAM